MTKATFETASLAAAVSNAAKVAPSKGSAFDKSNGIVIEMSPSESMCIIRATDTEIFYSEWIDAEMDGDSTVWRIPAFVFAGVCSSLPIGSGKTVTIEEDGGRINLKCGRTKSRFMLIDAKTYPTWSTFDPDELTHVKALGEKMKRVEWSASKSMTEVPLNGVHLNGEIALCTNRYRLAKIPLVIPELETPVTVPARTLSTLISAEGETAIGMDGNNFLMMPDDHSQIRSITYADQYPNVSRITEMVYDHNVTFRKQDLIACINRATAFAGSDRLAVLRLFFGKEEIAVMMTNEEIGFLGDVVETPGYGVHDRVEVNLDPQNILDALNNAPNEEVSIGYNPEKTTAVLHVNSGEYDAWVAPRQG